MMTNKNNNTVNSLSKAKQSKAKQSKAKQSKAKQSKANAKILSLINNSFKTFLITSLSFTLLFSISCSNEDTTGAGGGGREGTQQIDGKIYPAWYLTKEEQEKPFSMGPTRIFSSTLKPLQHYRIPAIIVATNGNIVVFADDRYNHGGDIGANNPKKQDIVYKFSTNGGKTWSPQKYITPLSPSASLQNADNKGDVIVFKALDGTLVALAVSGGGYANGGKNNSPSRMVRSESTDNGENWSPWREVGKELFEEIKKRHNSTQAAMSSGRGLTLKDGTFVAGMAGPDWSLLYVYSTNKGETWKFGQHIPGTDKTQNNNNKNNLKYNLWVGEPKVIAELEDGRLLMSIRNATQGGGGDNNLNPRKYIISTTSATSNPAVTWPTTLQSWDFRDGDSDAEGVVWTRKSDNHDMTRILHIQAGPNRRNGLALYLSENEGNSFNEVYRILQSGNNGACYSSIDVLGDGTVVIAAEEATIGGKGNSGPYYDIVFRRYNMHTITKGKYFYKTKWYKGEIK